MIIDCHSHFLAHIDDGAKTTAESIEILKWSKECGVDTMISTSHCYPKNEETISTFLERRKDSLARLQASLAESGDAESIPDIRLGAEVNLITDISEFENLKDLCIEGTNYMLVEMPWIPWREWMYDCIYSLTVHGIRPIIAHIERCFANEAHLHNLFRLDNVIYQINSTAFTNSLGRKLIKKLNSEKAVHIIGSDTHNMTDRKSDIKLAYDAMEKYYGSNCKDIFIQNATNVLANERVVWHDIEPLGFFERLRK